MSEFERDITEAANRLAAILAAQIDATAGSAS